MHDGARRDIPQTGDATICHGGGSAANRAAPALKKGRKALETPSARFRLFGKNSGAETMDGKTPIHMAILRPWLCAASPKWGKTRIFQAKIGSNLSLV